MDTMIIFTNTIAYNVATNVVLAKGIKQLVALVIHK